MRKMKYRDELIRILDVIIPCLIVICIMVGVYEYMTDQPILNVLGLDGKTSGMIDIFGGLFMIPIFYYLKNLENTRG